MQGKEEATLLEFLLSLQDGRPSDSAVGDGDRDHDHQRHGDQASAVVERAGLVEVADHHSEHDVQ